MGDGEAELEVLVDILQRARWNSPLSCTRLSVQLAREGAPRTAEPARDGDELGGLFPFLTCLSSLLSFLLQPLRSRSRWFAWRGAKWNTT